METKNKTNLELLSKICFDENVCYSHISGFANFYNSQEYKHILVTKIIENNISELTTVQIIGIYDNIEDMSAVVIKIIDNSYDEENITNITSFLTIEDLVIYVNDITTVSCSFVALNNIDDVNSGFSLTF